MRAVTAAGLFSAKFAAKALSSVQHHLTHGSEDVRGSGDLALLFPSLHNAVRKRTAQRQDCMVCLVYKSRRTKSAGGEHPPAPSTIQQLQPN